MRSMRKDLNLKKPNEPTNLAYPIKDETYQSLRCYNFVECAQNHQQSFAG